MTVDAGAGACLGPGERHDAWRLVRRLIAGV